jgi:histidinol dehydrogenase
VFVDSLADAAAVASRYAPEHLQLAVGPDAIDSVAAQITNAGEILLGQHTPFSAANYLIGCPASLPTSGFAHVSSGITVEAFLKRTAIARADEAALAAMAPAIVALADHEGFPAHAATPDPGDPTPSRSAQLAHTWVRGHRLPWVACRLRSERHDFSAPGRR